MCHLAKPHKFFVTAAALLSLTGTPAFAQLFISTGNSEVGTVGDLDQSKLRSRVANNHALRFGPGQLFAGSEVFSFPTFRPFIFSLPNFSSTQDFTGVSFNDYLERVASSFGLNVNDYLLQFQFQNSVTAADSTFIPTFQQVIQIHQNDFLAGGGFLPFGQPTIPNKPQEAPEPFTPLEPVFTTPTSPSDGTAPPGDGIGPVQSFDTSTTTDTNDVANLATEIVGGGTLNVDSTGSLTLEGNSVVGESQTAANVAVVPEPATLGMLTLGGVMMLGRRRR